MEQIFKWIMYIANAFFVIYGSLVCLGRLQASKALPKEHILNRAYGTIFLMSGAGMLLYLLPGNSTLQWPLGIIGMFLIFNSGVLHSKLNIEVRRLAETEKPV